MFIKHKEFLFSMANCGIMTKDIAKDSYNIHHKTLNELIADNIITKKGNLLLYGKISTIYVLSENTKNIIRKKAKYPYKTNISQLEHDYLLLKFYSKLPFHIQSTWINETELKEICGTSTTIDAMFILNNKKIGLEVLTSNYTKTMKKNKLEFGNIYCDKLITMNTSDIKANERT
ncbi:hypothetical protein FDA33_10325 [Clostridium botulinum]|nr:hypothetical protein [Clostridium botulinum]ALT05401.1 hypothetical protein [Clostridium botulinum]MBY6811046.1 hypothetical protein [Clostridium botulinum]MBY6818523.1 hypothetical protein [Clostridium botulinum]MBY6824514.1 hypothetical protein [Clostridium botulinum]MBY6828817.1 hypothetical protein [Clostridium botulinum]